MPILVTGASGFIGSHVVKQLLDLGHDVRACARSPLKAKFLETISENGSLEIVRMDLLDLETVRAAVRGCEDVIHCAAALYVGAKDPQRDVVDPSIKGTENLCLALQEEGVVKRIVHTSSVAAIRRTYYKNGDVFSVEDWCDDATVKNNAYGLAKAGGEKVMRGWASTSDLHPRLVTIHPSVVFGPVFDSRHFEGSMSYMKHFVSGPPFVLRIHINFVDVRDVAAAHVAALEKGENGGRYLLHRDGLWMQEIGLLLRKLRPRKKWPVKKLPKLVAYMFAIFHPKLNVKQLRSTIGKWVSYDIGDVEQQLELEFHSVEDTICDSVDSIVDKRNN